MGQTLQKYVGLRLTTCPAYLLNIRRILVAAFLPQAHSGRARLRAVRAQERATDLDSEVRPRRHRFPEWSEERAFPVYIR